MVKKTVSVILNQDVPDLGTSQACIKVASGYARNYLLPNKLVTLVTKANLARVKSMQDQKNKLNTEKYQEKLKIKDCLDIINKISIKKKVSHTGQLFGSVNTSDIQQVISSVLGIPVDKDKISLPEDLKQPGLYQVRLEIFGNIKAIVKLQIIPEVV